MKTEASYKLNLWSDIHLSIAARFRLIVSPGKSLVYDTLKCRSCFFFSKTLLDDSEMTSIPLLRRAFTDITIGGKQSEYRDEPAFPFVKGRELSRATGLCLSWRKSVEIQSSSDY